MIGRSIAHTLFFVIVTSIVFPLSLSAKDSLPVSYTTGQSVLFTISKTAPLGLQTELQTGYHFFHEFSKGLNGFISGNLYYAFEGAAINGWIQRSFTMIDGGLGLQLRTSESIIPSAEAEAGLTLSRYRYTELYSFAPYVRTAVFKRIFNGSGTANAGFIADIDVGLTARILFRRNNETAVAAGVQIKITP